MATNTLGRNITFPIYNADGSAFHDLELKKATVDSVVMSLGDKITGDVYYKDNTLLVTMQEYVEYKRSDSDTPTKYVLVNPPTIVKEGHVSENGELKGMTKYSFEFYHPMYVLNNFPFADVATSSDEQRYLSENKKFSWIGTPNDYISKLNKNLENTEWIVVKSDRFPTDKDDVLSGVLTFDNNTIADALKTFYETYEIPFVIDNVMNYESYYSLGKRFKVIFGLPSNEIYDNRGNVYVFEMGQGVGLKNNSRTPRNNKIITRIAGYGSEDNIPYGYPQIIWTGNQSWTNTKNDASDPTSYPIYEGIVGGRYVKLIKHPFTRNHLMPSIYSETVNKKVNPLSDGYNPNIELIDYYDAITDRTYPYVNEINPTSPSYEIHEFETIKPEMDDGVSEVAIDGCVPIDNNGDVAPTWDDSIDDDGNYKQSYFKITLPILSFDLYACAAITQEMEINMRSGACIGCTFPIQVNWDDYRKNFYDSEGNFVPNGAQRDLNKYPKSNEQKISIIAQKEYTTFGTIMPNVYQQPTQGDKFVVLGISLPVEYITNAEHKLDDEMKSYMLENNVYYFDYPLKFDSYFLALNTNILSQIRPNSVIRFLFAGTEMQLYVKQLTIKFGENVLPQYDITLTDNIEAVINQIGKVNDEVESLSTIVSAIQQEYSRNVWSELAKKLSKTNNDTAQGLITFLQGIAFGNGTYGIDNDGNATLNSVSSPNFTSGELAGTGYGLYTDELGVSTAEVDKLIVRMKAVFQELEIKKKSITAGDVGFSDAANKALVVLPMKANGDISIGNDGTLDFGNAEAYRVMWLEEDGEQAVYNTWAINDQARCQTFNIKSGTYNNVSNRYYWRKVIGGNFGEASTPFEWDGGKYNYIDLAANVTGTYKGVTYTKGRQQGITNDIPAAGDDIIQIGNQSNTDRQNYTEIIVNGNDAPAIKQYQGINDYTLSDKLVRGDYYDPIKGTYRSVTYGDFYVGDKEREGGYAEYDKDTKTFNIKGKLQVGSTLDDGRDINDIGIRKGNLLRNSGFTGEYESESVTSTTKVNADTPIYSDPFDLWQHSGCDAIEDSSSASGMSANIGQLGQIIDGGLTVGEWYTFSFRGRNGRVTVTVGGVSKTFELTTTLTRYDYSFVCVENTPFMLVGNGCNVMELQLMAGNIPSEWHGAHKDNDSALAEFYSNEYLRNAITEASTTINGGLILSQILKVGNYRDRVMNEETGGMSGAYTDDKSPFLWGGGTMEQAIYTIMKYANNPSYQPTNSEVAQMAKFVVTHGGRAILNDIILRGYIYALGGVFNGTVYAIDGEFNGTVNANKGIFGGLVTTNFKDVRDADGELVPEIPWIYTMGREDLSIMYNQGVPTRMTPDVGLVVILPVDEYYIGKEVNITCTGLVYDQSFLDSIRVRPQGEPTPSRENTYIFGIQQYEREIGGHTIYYYATNEIVFDGGVLSLVGVPYKYWNEVDGESVEVTETKWVVKSFSYRIMRYGEHGLAISDLPQS